MKDDRLYLHHMLERCHRITRFIGPGPFRRIENVGGELVALEPLGLPPVSGGVKPRPQPLAQRFLRDGRHPVLGFEFGHGHAHSRPRPRPAS